MDGMWKALNSLKGRVRQHRNPFAVVETNKIVEIDFLRNESGVV